MSDSDFPFKTLGVALTQYCNRHCPECCFDLAKWSFGYVSVAEIQQVGTQVYGQFAEVGLSGGEASLHPQLEEIVRGAKTWFGCRTLSIITNGHRLPRILALMPWLDLVYISKYGPDFPDRQNTEAIDEFVRQAPPEKVQVGIVNTHVPRSRRGPPGSSCGRIVAKYYCAGQLWPCCVAPGVDGAVGIPLPQADWSNQLQVLHAPCENCFFAGLD